MTTCCHMTSYKKTELRRNNLRSVSHDRKMKGFRLDCYVYLFTKVSRVNSEPRRKPLVKASTRDEDVNSIYLSV